MTEILLVEHEGQSRGDLERLLATTGLEVVTAANDQDALQILEGPGHHIDLLMLDLMMPRFAGWKLLTQLRANESLSRLPVIILSSLAVPPQNLGAKAHLRKPIDPNLLVQTIRDLLAVSEPNREVPAHPRETTRRAPVSFSPGTRKVLVVDDDYAIRETVAEILEDCGFRALTACDGVEALKIIGRESPTIDLIVLDLMMPGCDGWDLLQHFREMPELSTIPVLAISALTRAARDVKVSAFLAKPFDQEKLVETAVRLTEPPQQRSVRA
jgi:CheY-like chemotaxis protein